MHETMRKMHESSHNSFGSMFTAFIEVPDLSSSEEWQESWVDRRGVIDVLDSDSCDMGRGADWCPADVECPKEKVLAAIREFPMRLELCREAKGGHFEHMIPQSARVKAHFVEWALAGLAWPPGPLLVPDDTE